MMAILDAGVTMDEVRVKIKLETVLKYQLEVVQLVLFELMKSRWMVPMML